MNAQVVHLVQFHTGIEMLASLPIVFLCSVLAILPLCLCAVAARSDAMRQQRRFGHRIFYSAVVDTALYLAFIAVMYVILMRQPRAPNVFVGINWSFVVFLAGFVFLFAAFIGAVGYAISYRLFERPRVNDSVLDTPAPVARVDETGNPYQPPGD